MKLILNGQTKDFPALATGSTVQRFVDELALKGDRIAIELNGDIVPRKQWVLSILKDDDKLEVVHFVGGGLLGA